MYIYNKLLLIAGNPAGDSETSSMMIAHAAVEYVGKYTFIHIY